MTAPDKPKPIFELTVDDHYETITIRMPRLPHSRPAQPCRYEGEDAVEAMMRFQLVGVIGICRAWVHVDLAAQVARLRDLIIKKQGPRGEA
jgi:hypothetical protein